MWKEVYVVQIFKIKIKRGIAISIAAGARNSSLIKFSKLSQVAQSSHSPKVEDETNKKIDKRKVTK